jgi:hypothetical protein
VRGRHRCQLEGARIRMRRRNRLSAFAATASSSGLAVAGAITLSIKMMTAKIRLDVGTIACALNNKSSTHNTGDGVLQDDAEAAAC